MRQLSAINQAVTARLEKASGPYFILWCLIASFGTYFCMYAFRKPFSTGQYQGLVLWGLDYKVVLIIAQVIGYMVSKFIGIKVISELRPSRRVGLSIALILFAEAALLLFGMVPYPYNFYCLFLNGLPLGMIWGIVFSFLEGRRFTELLGFGLNVSVIVASGILKTIYLELESVIHASEFWMPFIMGALFFPVFCFFVWMLSVIPAPTAEDMQLRAKRAPMTREDKNRVWKEYRGAILCTVIAYALLTTMRDLRDNFSVEIWGDMEKGWSRAVLSQTELITGVIVLAAVGAIAFIRNNGQALWVTIRLMGFGVLTCGIATALFQAHLISPFLWMLILGMGLFLAYIPMQTVLFERMIGLFRINANAGYLVYLCDAAGYLGSVALMLCREFFLPHASWLNVLIRFSYGLSIVCIVLILLTAFFLSQKVYKKKPSTGDFSCNEKYSCEVPSDH